MLKSIVLVCVLVCANLSAEANVLFLSGSTREGSIHKKLILEAAEIARHKNLNVTVIDLKDFPIPFYDGDLESKEGMPVKAKQLRQVMIQNDVIVIASPEYNGSVPAILKNAIDWASRGENGGSSRDAFKGKKFLLMSASPGTSGGNRGLVHLRAIIESIGGIVQKEQFTVPNAYTAFNEKGCLKDPKLKVELQQLIQVAIQ